MYVIRDTISSNLCLKIVPTLAIYITTGARHFLPRQLVRHSRFVLSLRVSGFFVVGGQLPVR